MEDPIRQVVSLYAARFSEEANFAHEEDAGREETISTVHSGLTEA
jgi:hypothetical protein